MNQDDNAFYHFYGVTTKISGELNFIGIVICTWPGLTCVSYVVKYSQ